MVSVSNNCEIDRKSAAATNISLFGTEKPQEGTRISDAVQWNGDTEEARVSSEIDSLERNDELEFSITEETRVRVSSVPAPGQGEMNMDSETMVRVSGSKAGDEGLSSEELRVSIEAQISSGWDSPRLELSEESKGLENWMNGLETGNMVWGKVKSHPWWPGHIFNEAFASPSVQRTKREGHVLVAFFGDSSFGWFDPAELIPFDSHFPEKSRQTSSRNFVKAVEEAVDEASRRGALALACRCRNPFNFRSMNVPGYFAVDVLGYEPGGIYSMKQIRKARDSFEPVEALSFVQQLAVAPKKSESSSIEWIQSMAMMLAYRRAVFEEFDETYAQAFGVQPVRPSQNAAGMPDQLDRFPSRAAPLSGPLVIAEALGNRKSSTKPAKSPKEPSSKKNKYLFKRREEPQITSTPKPHPVPPQPQITQSHGNIQYYTPPPAVQQPNLHYVPHGQATAAVPSPPVFKDAADVGIYYLQKRSPTTSAENKHPIPAKQEDSKAGGHEQKASDWVAEFAELKSDERKLKWDSPMVGLDEGIGDVAVKPESHVAVIGAESISSQDGLSSVIDSTEPKVASSVPAWDSRAASVPSPTDVKLLPGKVQEAKVVVRPVKKAKVPKRPREDLGPDEPDDTGEVKKKKKKKKKDFGIESGPDHPSIKEVSKDGDTIRRSAEKSVGFGREELQTKDDGAGKPLNLTDSVLPLPNLELGSPDLDLPLLVSDLSALALDPFHGIERNAPSIARNVFLKFRSLVYQKSLVLPPASEPDTPEFRPTKSAHGRSIQEPGIVNAEAGGEVRERREPSSTSKPFKSSLKSDDPTKSGRKRNLSERQEEKSAKRLKKLDQLKALATEKKAGAGQKTPDAPQRGDQKDISTTTTTTTTIVAPAKANKAEPVKKQEPPPPRPVTPTTLVMKFPPRTTLPSVASLKARFARFGPLDLSGTRVYWKSHTCKVLFRYKSDAQAAYIYVRSNDLFGQVKVNYHLRELEVLAPEQPEPGKGTAEARSDDGLQFRPGNGGNNSSSHLRPSALQQQRQQSGQLKSCLKKPGDDIGPAGPSVVKESPRVKFLLGADDDRGEPSVMVTSNNIGGSIAERNPSSIPSLGVNSKNPNTISFLPPPPPPPLPLPNRVLDLHLPPPPPPPPLLPLPLHRAHIESHAPPQFGKSQPHRVLYSEVDGRDRSKVDISHQMLSLLFRCNDIVTNVKSSLGYVPYHSL